VQGNDLQQFTERRAGTRLCRQRLDETVGAAEKRDAADGQRATEKGSSLHDSRGRRATAPAVSSECKA
jgi:hypothetical protein